jgi:hypothetical protein
MCRCRECAEQNLGQAKRTEHVGRERTLEILTFGVRQRRERHRAERRRIVHEDVESAQCTEQLNRDRVDVFLSRDVSDDAAGVRQLASDAFDARATACDERHMGPVFEQASDQGQSEPGRATCDRDTQPFQRCSRHAAS